MVEQVIRPTGLLDPTIEVKPTQGQIDDLLHQIRDRVEKGERCLVTTLTKRMAEELSDYLQEMNVKTHYLHSEIDTLQAQRDTSGTSASACTTWSWASTSSEKDWTSRRSAW